MKIELEDGKYTYVFNNGEQYALRYGESWRDLTGDKFIYCMAARIDELEAKIKRLREALIEENPLAWSELLSQTQ